MAYASALGGVSTRNSAITSVLRGWAEKDVEAATAWAQQLPPGQLRNQALSSVLSALAALNQQAAFDLMQSSGVSQRQYGYASQIFNAWADADTVAAAAKAAELSGQQR